MIMEFKLRAPDFEKKKTNKSKDLGHRDPFSPNSPNPQNTLTQV